MESDVDFTVALDCANRKIADLNMKILQNNAESLQNELNKWLQIKQEIYNGNTKIIKMVINNEI